MRKILCLLVSLSLVGRVSSQAFTPTISACLNSDGDAGYGNIPDMNADIQREYALILGGKTPEPSYQFVLCPNTDLDGGNETLVPLLDNSMFLCGEDGTSPGCGISGGEVQVNIGRPVDGTHSVTAVSFVGVDFKGFSGAAISGDGVKSTTVTISQSSFSNYNAMFAVQQQTTDGLEPFSVTLQDVTVQNAVGGVAFSNIGGVLSAQNLVFSNSNLMGGVSTGSSVQGNEVNVGMTMVVGASVSTSSIMDLFVAMEGGRLNAADIAVSEMTGLTNIFDIAGTGSLAEISGLMITNNDFRATDPPPLWSGVNVRDNAMASVADITVEDSTNIRYLFGAQNSSMLSVESFDGLNMVGGRQVAPDEVSAVFFADTSSEAVVTDTGVENSVLFTAIAFANGMSNIQYRQSCIGMGSVLATVFISENSTHTVEQNYIDPAFMSTDFCMDQGMRLVKEQRGQTCFEQQFESCMFDCMVAAELQACPRQADTNTTAAPVAVTVTPTQAPVATTGAPTGSPVMDTTAPTQGPTVGTTAPTTARTGVPTGGEASDTPSLSPSSSSAPTTVNATAQPTTVPTSTPTTVVESEPTSGPVAGMTSAPTSEPTSSPVAGMTSAPTAVVVSEPTSSPVDGMTALPTSRPTFGVESEPTGSPTPPVSPPFGGTTPMPTQKASTKSPTSSGTPDTLAPTNEPTKKCLKKGKWVKRHYKQQGKGGYHVYYAFDENLCAEYDSEFFRPSGGTGSTSDNGPHQAVVFNKYRYSESSVGSSSSSRSGRRKYHRKPRKPRNRKKQTRIWIREENNLRRGRN